ncbi:MAG: DUF934 domain-containing protein [Gemmobacter sp.]
MNVIVTDSGFSRDDFPGPWTLLHDLAPGTEALDLPNHADPAALAGRLAGVGLVRIGFPAFSDGRGFTLARRLRLQGYRGRLRAAGPLIADQYAMLRRAGFDEVEIPDEIAARQPEAQWLFRADWQHLDHRSRIVA